MKSLGCLRSLSLFSLVAVFTFLLLIVTSIRCDLIFRGIGDLLLLFKLSLMS